jgi:XTP/dITP diphosphohydrolase
MKILYFITGNKGKAQEAEQKLQSLGFTVVPKDLGYPEVQADTLEEVALRGVEHVQVRFDKPFILEDAGLFIDALHGFPGVYSKYVFLTIGLQGILRLLEREKNKDAVFRSVYAYSEPGKKPILGIGECKGKISPESRGKNGFGYDPIFIPNGSEKTFGEMTIKEKNSYSHRAKALENLVTQLRNPK